MMNLCYFQFTAHLNDLLQANDLAHKAMLRDLIPMIAMRGKYTDGHLSRFETK